MKKYLLFSLIAVFFCINERILYAQNIEEIKITEERKQKNETFLFNIIPSVNNTWCYDIIKDKKLLIHQTSIPGLPGNEGFKTKSDAEKVARLVIDKLKKGEMPPSVTKDELKNLQVINN